MRYTWEPQKYKKREKKGTLDNEWTVVGPFATIQNSLFINVNKRGESSGEASIVSELGKFESSRDKKKEKDSQLNP